MPQLDLYVWGNTLTLFIYFFVLFYIFWVYGFVIMLSKSLYIRKHFFSKFELNDKFFNYESKFILCGIYLEKFLFFVKNHMLLLELVFSIGFSFLRYCILVFYKAIVVGINFMLDKVKFLDFFKFSLIFLRFSFAFPISVFSSFNTIETVQKII